MSNFLDTVRTDSPEHLYMFNTDAAGIASGVLPDLGYGTVNGAYLSNDGVKVVPTDPILSGELLSQHVEVHHERGANLAGSNFSAVTVSGGVAGRYFGPNQIGSWTIEALVGSKTFNRARSSESGVLIGHKSVGVAGLKYNYNQDTGNRYFEFSLYVNGVYTVLITSQEFSPSVVSHVAVVKSGTSYSMVVDGSPEGRYSLQADDVLDTLTSTDVRIGGWDSRESADAIIAAVALYPSPLPTSTLKSHSESRTKESPFLSVVEGFNPDFVLEPESGIGVVEPFVQSLSEGTDSRDLYEAAGSNSITITDEAMGAGAVSKTSKSYEFDLSGLTAGISSKFDYEATVDANSSVTPEYSLDDVSYSTLTEGVDTVPELNAFSGTQLGAKGTYYEGEYDNNYVLQGNGGGVEDTGPRNLFPLNVAAVTNGSSLYPSGTEIVSLGFIEPPEFASTGTIADDAINRGVMGFEWTGTGTSEQITSLVRTVRVKNGDTIGVGAWVYVESPSSLPVKIRWIGFNSSGVVTVTSGISTTSVTPNEWTYITRSSTLNDASTLYARLYIEADGAQQIGDKIYIGAVFLGIDESSWVYPTTPSNGVIDLRFTAKILGDGSILSNRSVDGVTDGNGFHIEAWNQGFHVKAGTQIQSAVETVRSYTTATDIYDYNRWYSFRWKYDRNSGSMDFYILDRGQWVIIDSGAVSTSSDALITSYGIKTLATGVNVGGSNLHLNSFGMNDTEDYGWEVSERGLESNSLEVIGSEVGVAVDGGTQVEDNLILRSSGWILSSVNNLEVTHSSDHDFGSGDFTAVFNVTSPSTQDGAVFSKGGASGVEFTVDTGVTTPSISVAGTSFSGTTPVFDGDEHVVVLQRTQGTTLDLFVDEFITASDSFVDTAGDPTNTSDTLIGGRSSVAPTTFLSGMVGVYVVFNRILEDYERDELGLWVEAGHLVSLEPDWLRTEASLYLNADDPVQRAESTQNGRLINLAVTVPETIYVRYTLSSVDGISNPVLTKNYLSIGNLPLIEDVESYEVKQNEVVPLNVSPVGLPHTSYLLDGNLLVEVDGSKFGSEWLNEPFTIGFWFKSSPESDGATERVLIGQGTTKKFTVSTVQNGVNSSIVVTGNATALTTPVNSDYTDRMHFGVIVFDGINYRLYVDAVQIGTGSNVDLSGIDGPLYVGGFAGSTGFKGNLGVVMAFRRSLTAPEVASLYRSGPTEQEPNFQESIIITETVSYVTLNWERA